jgi:hypothetical protein
MFGRAGRRASYGARPWASGLSTRYNFGRDEAFREVGSAFLKQPDAQPQGNTAPLAFENAIPRGGPTHGALGS